LAIWRGLSPYSHWVAMDRRLLGSHGHVTMCPMVTRAPGDRMEELLRLEMGGQLPEFLHFWGHTPKTNSPVGPWVLSRWWPSPFVIDGVEYFHSEGFMMAGKGRLFGDASSLARILQEQNPAVAKHLGQQVSNFDEGIWVSRRYELVIEGNAAKFSQAPLLASYLGSTAPKVLVEASPRDVIWGIGLAGSDPNAQIPSEWRGANLLGFALVEVREQLMRTSPGAAHNARADQ
jgi:ribA/ribD-fused uncharacterized protein